MKTKIKAVFEQGILRLLEPVDLNEGEEIIVTLDKNEKNIIKQNPHNILTKISQKAVVDKEDHFSGEDHDEILYGKGLNN